MNSAASARERFLLEYRHIRHAEGRGSHDSGYYCALPFRDLSGRNEAMWAMRATTYRHFVSKVLKPLEAGTRRALDILDLGAGNCWLSHQLARRQHRPIAIDIFSDNLDGLAAARHYPLSFPVIESDFDAIPLPSSSIDLAIFNASLHYSTDYEKTLTEVRRCLRPSGTVVILDSPVYRRREHGLRMVQEKHAEFLQRYGFPSDSLPSLEFLDLPTLRHLHEVLGIEWQVSQAWYSWKWHLRPLMASLRRRRPPSRFLTLVGSFPEV